MANPSQQEVAQAVYDLTSKWKPEGASQVQSWWPPTSQKPEVDVVHALRVQAERIDAAGEVYYPYPVYYGAHDNSRWEWAGLTWTAPMLVDPATGQLSHAYATSVLNEDLEALKKELWGGGDAPRPTPEDVINVRALYCNEWDTSPGHVVPGGDIMYGPSIPWAIEHGRYDVWMEYWRSHGCTHVIIGPFDPGPAYPGVGDAWKNPDNLAPEKLRSLVLQILNTPSATGRGFVPILFLDGGGPDPKPRIDARWKGWGEALADLQDFLIIVPAWEPVRGDWTSAQVSYALQRMREWFPTARIGVHTSPNRGSFASNPVEPDDPWQGDESACWKSHGGEFASIHFYQTEHGDDLYEPTTCNCALWPQKFGHQDSNEKCAGNRCEDDVARSGAGHNGWRILDAVVLMETAAFEIYRKEKTAADADHIRALMRERVYAKWGVKFTYGQ